MKQFLPFSFSRLKHSVFFVGLVLFLMPVVGKGQVTPIRTDVSGFTSWADTDLAGTIYLQLTMASSSTISPAMNFNSFVSEKLNFKARTFGGVNATRNVITVTISTDNGNSWSLLGTRTPTSTTLTSMAEFDLSSYNGSQVKIRFQSLAGSGSTPGGGIGFGIDDITIIGTASSTPTITSSVTSLSFGNVATGSSAAQSFTVSGSNLTNDITITPPTADFQIRKGSDPFASTAVTLTKDGSGNVATTTIDVQYTPPGLGNHNGDITLVSGTANKTIPVSGTGSAPIVTPTVQASALTFSATNISITANWTSGNGSNRIVYVNTSNAFTDPANGTDPSASVVYTTGQQVVFNGSGNSVTVTGLSANTMYWFRVYEYNGTGAATQFNVNTATDNPLGFSTLAAPCVPSRAYFQGFETNNNWPIVSSTTGSISPAAGGVDFPANQRILTGTKSWQTNDGTNTLELDPVDVSNFTGKKIRIRLSSTSTSNSNGADAADYVKAFISTNGNAFPATADVTVNGGSNSKYGYSGAAVASTTAGTPLIVASNTSTFYATIEIIIPDNANTVALKLEAKNNDASELWNVDDIEVLGCEIATCNEPATAAANLNVVPTPTTAQLDWTIGSGSKRMVIISPNVISNTELPVDGNSYLANAAYNTAAAAIGAGFVVFNGNGNAVTVTNLVAASTYYYAIVEYDCTPENYSTNTYLTGSFSTPACTEPTIEATALLTPVIKDERIDLSWTNGNGTGRIVLVKPGSPLTTADYPTNGNTYAVNDVVGNAKIVYKGTGNFTSVSGLSTNTTYYFGVFEYNCAPEQYRTAAFAAASATTQPEALIRYSFNGSAGNETTFAADAQPANATVSDISRNNLTASGFSDAFSASGFPTSTTINTNSYYTFTITPDANYKLNLARLELDERRSGTGIRKWTVRSSVDNFATDLSAVFDVPDNTNVREDNEIPLGSAFSNLTTAVEFRFYGYAAEATGGTWYVDNVQAFGSVTPLPPSAITKVQFAQAAKTVYENENTVSVNVLIAGESATMATSVDVVLKTGDPSDVNNYTTQTVTFLAGSAANQTVVFTLTDDLLNEGTETLTFELENLTGGNQATLDNQSLYTLKIIDNELPEIHINEFHYTNTGADADEFVEVMVSTIFTDLASVTLSLYNGNDGATYGTYNLSAFATNDQVYDGYKIYALHIPAIQNGDPDGFSLDYANQLIQFISYGGTFTATTGAASGTLSTDVGVTETDSDPAGSSLFLAQPGSSGVWSKQTTANTFGLPNVNNPLPVELLNFTAKAKENATLLTWETASEKHSHYFEIERSRDARLFETIGKVNAQGNSATIKRYAFEDKNPYQSLAYYRLKQVDLDGTVAYSKTVAASRDDLKAIAKVYPNPAQHTLTIAFAKDKFKGRIQVIDLLGRTAKTISVDHAASEMDLNVADLPAGIYYLKMENQNEVIKFIKLK